MGSYRCYGDERFSQPRQPAVLLRSSKHSAHTKAVDVVLNDAMRLISGTLKPTPKEMLPVVSGIPPASIRRDYQVLELAEKAVKEDSLFPPVQDDTIPQRIPKLQRSAGKAHSPPLGWSRNGRENGEAHTPLCTPSSSPHPQSQAATT